MKRLLLFILPLFISCAAFAQTSSPASTASIQRLLELTNTPQLYDATMKQMSTILDKHSGRLMNQIPPEKQAKFKEMLKKMDAMVQEEMSWKKMAPEYVKIYAETFTQKEIDDLIAFYNTPSGQSFIKKQPLVLQRTMALSQEKMGIMMGRLPGMVQQLMSEGN